MPGSLRRPALRLLRRRPGLHDADGKVTIPGFYDDVVELTAEERGAIASLPYDEADFLSNTGSPCVAGEKG